MGRITIPFRVLFQREIKSLKRGYRDVLMDVARRDAFDSLLRTLSSELGAMSYAKIPTVLDVMLLTGLVDNRKLLIKLSNQLEVLKSKIKQLNMHVNTFKRDIGSDAE